MSQNTIESYEVDGKLYVNTRFLCAYLSKSDKQIGRWKKVGCPTAEKPRGLSFRGDVFFLDEVIKWVDENINKSKSNATRKRDTEIHIPDDMIEETVNDIQGKIKQANQMLQLSQTTHDDADRIKKILDGLIQAVKLGEQTKNLIPKKDTEKVIVEFVATLIAGYKKDIKLLPKECENRTELEIRGILKNTYKTNIEKFKKIAKSKMLSETKLYDVIIKVLELIQDDIDTKDIINELNKLKNSRDK